MYGGACDGCALGPTQSFWSQGTWSMSRCKSGAATEHLMVVTLNVLVECLTSTKARFFQGGEASSTARLRATQEPAHQPSTTHLHHSQHSRTPSTHTDARKHPHLHPHTPPQHAHQHTTLSSYTNTYTPIPGHTLGNAWVFAAAALEVAHPEAAWPAHNPAGGPCPKPWPSPHTRNVHTQRRAACPTRRA